VNAAGCVEKIRCVLSEWTLPLGGDLNKPVDFTLARDSYRYLLGNMCDAFNKNKDVDQKLPVSIAAEMRMLGGSDTILSPTKFRTGPNGEQIKYFALPEIVTHSIGNPNWNIFLRNSHEHMKLLLGNAPLLMHLAKEGFEGHGALKWIREQYDKINPNDLKAFVKFRDEVDPEGMFTNDFFEQLFGSSVRGHLPADTFQKPKNWEVVSAGGMHN